MNKYGYTFILLQQAGITEESDRKKAIFIFTEGRTDSLTKLSFDELKAFNASLAPRSQPSKAERMRKKIIHLLAAEGSYSSAKTTYVFVSQKKPNMEGINDFIKAVGYLKKSLNTYTEQELTKLVSQIEVLLKNTQQSQANKAVDAMLIELEIKVQI